MFLFRESYESFAANDSTTPQHLNIFSYNNDKHPRIEFKWSKQRRVIKKRTKNKKKAD